MKFTLSWLKTHLETEASLDQILATLNTIGLEVEGVEDRVEVSVTCANLGAAVVPPAQAFGFNPTDALTDLRMSEKSMPLYEHVKRFIAETVEPMSVKYAALGEGRTGADRWEYAPGQLDLLNGASAAPVSSHQGSKPPGRRP